MENKWEQKVYTHDDTFVCEITNGKISICVNDDGEEEHMQAIVDGERDFMRSVANSALAWKEGGNGHNQNKNNE